MNLVDWDRAQKVAARVAGSEPFSSSYLYESLEPDLERLTAVAEDMVEAETGLRATTGRARARVIDRTSWIDVNLAGFERLLQPVLSRIDSERLSSSVGRRIAGTEMGFVLGWMSRRVLGQYDLLVVEDEEDEEGDVVYYVGPNVLAIEKRHGFPPEEFRLWLALHEVTHRAQFTGVPWMRNHMLGLMGDVLGSVEPDPTQLVTTVRRVATARREGRNILEDGGLAALFASDEQKALMDEISGLMSLLEGHGDVTMNRAGADLIPNANRFSRVLHARRTSAKGTTRLMQRLVGLEAKLAQYRLGEEFIEVVEAERGPRVLDRVWDGPENIPTLAEIKDPEAWLERVAPEPALS